MSTIHTAPANKSMSHAARAAIASAFIFPGAGLFLLKHYVRGCIFALPATFIIVMMFKNLFSTAIAINEKLQEQAERGIFSFDVVAIFTQLHSSIFATPYWQDGKWILLASWVLSISSSYFVGKKFDLQQKHAEDK
ncbi:hypothetical protein [Cellvibrio mixtus]|uniref:hypothetical protein n=1 Tax=Cellvibrio mixtus TaxID=39650 RepID=UPI000ADF8336|nr:hypothetical protein [Cellvibrio mixtus]